MNGASNRCEAQGKEKKVSQIDPAFSWDVMDSLVPPVLSGSGDGNSRPDTLTPKTDRVTAEDYKLENGHSKKYSVKAF
jgi:hypothetical protein